MIGLVPAALGGAVGYLAGPTVIGGSVKEKDRPLVGAAVGAFFLSVLWPRVGAYGAISMGGGVKGCVGPGSTGSAVEALQQQLAAYYSEGAWQTGKPVPADWRDYFPQNEQGVLGATTVSVLKQLQAAEGIAVDGIAGPQTWAKLGFQGLPCTRGAPASRPRSAATAPGDPNTDALAQIEKAARQKKMLLWGGIGGGVTLLLLILVVTAK